MVFPNLSKAFCFAFCVITANPLVFTFNMNFIYGWKSGQTWIGAFLRVAPIAVAMAGLGSLITKVLMDHTKINDIWSFLGWAGIGNVDMITMAACGIANFGLTKLALTMGGRKKNKGGRGGKKKKA